MSAGRGEVALKHFTLLFYETFNRSFHTCDEALVPLHFGLQFLHLSSKELALFT